MNRLLKYALAVWLVAFAANAWSQTGLYYDEYRTGEGVNTYDDGERLVFYFYTLGGLDCEIETGVNVEATECATATAADRQEVCRDVTATATAECPDDKKGEPLCDPVVVSVTERVCAVAEVSATDTQCATAEAETDKAICSADGQRWFFGVDEFDGIESTGLLYAASGQNFPEGVKNPALWDGVVVGEAEPVGLYLMQWNGRGEGYTLTVIPFGASIDEGDPIYGVHNFPTLLIEPQ